VPTRQNSRFWISETNLTIIVGSIPNGGDVRRAAKPFNYAS
jgi:hypothetical protein